MRRIARSIALASVLALSLGAIAQAQDHGTHSIVSPDDLNWTAAPPALPSGTEIVVVSGNPGQEGPYVLRLKFPSETRVAPHTHPNDENLTVISGVFHIGTGDQFDEAKGQMLMPGGFARMPNGMPHFAWASEETVVQLHGIGPSGISYVNPADDPRNQ
jgi:quercetin dioxygenase-like cupin family protein